MKNRLKIRITVLLAVALLFGMPGFLLSPSPTQMSQSSKPVLEAFQRASEPLSVKQAMPTGSLGFPQKPIQVQKAEDIFVLQPGSSNAVQASVSTDLYQFGNISNVFSGEVIVGQSGPENLKVLPLQIAVSNIFQPASGSVIESYAFWPNAPFAEKSFLQVLPPVFRQKTSSVLTAASASTLGQGASGIASPIVAAERFVFRC